MDLLGIGINVCFEIVPCLLCNGCIEGENRWFVMRLIMIRSFHFSVIQPQIVNNRRNMQAIYLWGKMKCTINFVKSTEYLFVDNRENHSYPQSSMHRPAVNRLHACFSQECQITAIPLIPIPNLPAGLSVFLDIMH